MPNIIRMFQASDDALLATENVPSEGTHDPADIFDLTALDGVDVYFEMATEPTAEYTTPEFVAPTIASAHISDTQGGSVITEADEGDTLWAVANGVTGYPTPTLAYQWYVDASPAGGTDDEESFDSTGHEGDVTVEITVTNGAGSDDATSAVVAVASSDIFARLAAAGKIVFANLPDTEYTTFYAERTGASATTEVTGTGQVGTIKCETTGRYLTSTINDGNRPSVFEDGGGIKYIHATGGVAGMFAGTEAVDLSGDDSIAIVAVANVETTDALQQLVGYGISAFEAGSFGLEMMNDADSARLWRRSSTDVDNVFPSTREEKVVMTALFDINGASGALRARYFENGAEVSNSSSTGTGTGPFGSDKAIMFLALNTNSSRYFNSPAYSWIMVRNPTPEELAALVVRMAAETGVTL